MAGHLRHKWTERDIEILRCEYPDRYASEVAVMLGLTVKKVYQKAKGLGIRKSESWMKMELQRQAERLRRVGATKRFQKGLVPHNTTYDGCIRIRQDKSRRGYKYIRISKGKWIELHKALWIFLNGEIPDGKILRCKTEDTLNCDPDNWYLTDRASHLAKNAGRDGLGDKYVALVLARKDPQLREELMNYPEILDLKRTELTLKQTINENA